MKSVKFKNLADSVKFRNFIVQKALSANNFNNDNFKAGGEIPIAYHTLREEILLTLLNHIIVTHENRISSLNCLSMYMNKEKKILSSSVEELVCLKHEINQLQIKLAYFKKIQWVLMKLFTKTIKVYKIVSRMQKLH